MRSVEERNRLVVENRWLVPYFVKVLAKERPKFAAQLRVIGGFADGVGLGHLVLVRVCETWREEKGGLAIYFRCALLWSMSRYATTASLVCMSERDWERRLVDLPFATAYTPLPAFDCDDSGNADVLVHLSESPRGINIVDDADESAYRKRLVFGSLRHLHIRERTVLLLRYLECKTFDEIGERMSLSGERVRQLCCVAVRRLQLLLGVSCLAG